MIQFFNKISKLILFSFLVIFPFSYGDVTNRWIILFIPLIIALIVLHFLLKKSSFKINNFSLSFAILLIIIFDFTEKVNFIQQFNIPVEITNRIPLTTMLLTIGILLFLIKALIENKVKNTSHSIVQYFLFTCVFLFTLMVVFYPFLWYHYQMILESNIQLLNKIIKYLIVFLLTSNYASDKKNLKQINVGFIISLSTTVILTILF